MKIIILQHELDTPSGTTLEWLQQNQIQYEILHTAQMNQYPSLDKFDGLIVCGGSMNVDETELYPWLIQEKAFIQLALQAEKKILGICLGGQLLAEALGGSVSPMHKWEAGWFEIEIENIKITPFHWHRYGFSIPVQAVLIGSNKNTPAQAFAFKKNVLGFQFHPEVNESWIELALQEWNSNFYGAVQTISEIREQNKNYLMPLRSWYFSILDRHFLK